MRRCLALALVGLFLTPSVGDARPRRGAKKPVKQASAHADAAQLAFDVGEYGSAITEWQNAYKLSREGKYLFHIAEAFRMKGDCAESLRHYQSYLALKAPGGKRAEAEQQVATLSKQCPQTAPVEPPPEPPPPPEPVEIEPEPVVPVDSGGGGGGLKITGLVVGGVGLALGGTGLFFRLQAKSKADEVSDACRVRCNWGALEDVEADGKRKQTLGTALLIGGGVALVGGVVLFVVGSGRSRGDRVAVTPLPEGGMGVVWSGSF